VTNVSTGQTRFYMPEPMVRRGEGAIEVFTRHLAQQPAPRGITVNTIAVGSAIAALLDDSNRWVTGQHIEASGAPPVAPGSISTYSDSPSTSLQDQSEAPRANHPLPILRHRDESPPARRIARDGATGRRRRCRGRGPPV